MAERSLFANVMLFIIAVLLAIGIYLTIGAVDLFRRREERLIADLAEMRSDLTRMREELASGRLSAPPANPSAPIPNATERTNAMPHFPNMEVRDPAAVAGDGIVSVTIADTGNMNYIINNEYDVAQYWSITFDTVGVRNLINPDRWEPLLAESWEVSPDKLTYTIHLRHGALWHDFTDPTTGESFKDVEVKAQDFKFYMDVIQNPKIPCDSQRNYFQDLDQIKVLDDYTFQAIWKRRYFMSMDLTLGLQPLPRHFYRFSPDKAYEEFAQNNERNRMIVGCGPWIFQGWEKGKEVRFTRNERYYGPKPYLKSMVVRVIKEPTARLEALRHSELDRIDEGLLPEQWVKQTNDAAFNEKFAKFKYPERDYSYIGYNLRNDLFKDRRVRQALTMLTDRPRILREAYLGLGRITTGTFFVESPAYDRTIQPWPFDPARAKALLAEAGWSDHDGDGILDKDGKKFEFTFMTVSGAKIGEQVAEIVRQECSKAGIIVNINPLEWSVFLQRVEEWSFDVCTLRWMLSWDDDPYQLWHSSQADLKRSSNHVGFKNAEADKLIEAARVEFDPVKRNALYHQFDRILHEEQPYTFLINSDALVAQDKRFRNAKVYPLGMDVNSFWVPLAEQKYRE